jgi:hypothetical protein
MLRCYDACNNWLVFNIENVLWEAWMVGVCVLARVRVHVHVRVTLPC